MSLRHARALGTAPSVTAAPRTSNAAATGMARDPDPTPHVPLRVVRSDVPRDQIPLQRDRDEFLLRVATKLSRLGGWSVDIPTGAVYWSDEVCALHGVEAGFLPSVEQGISFYAPEHRAQITTLFAACAAEGRSFNTVLEIISALGRRIWVRVIAEAVRDESGTVVVVHGALQDITDRRLEQESIRVSEERFRFVAKATSDAIRDWDFATDRVWWNDGVAMLFGYPVSEELSTIEWWVNRIHPDERESIASRVRGVIDGDGDTWVGEYRFQRADGSYAHVLDRGYIVRQSDGDGVRMICGMTDITTRKSTELRLAQQAALLDAAHEAILVQDMHDHIIYWNKGAERTFGWSATEAHDRIASELFTIDAGEYQDAWAALLLRGAWEGEVRMQSRDGQLLSVDVRWTLVRNDRDDPVAVFAILSDVTERKRLEAQFLRAQRLDSLGTLAGGIAHDLNNVLAPIMLSIEFLRDGVSDLAKLEILRTIEASAERGAALVRQVLTFASGVEGRRATVDIGRLIREAQRILHTTFPKDIEIRLTIAPDLHAVFANPSQLDQLLMNLCVNARDAMPRGGVISITLANVMLDKTYAGMTADANPGPYVRLTVSDTGHGMSKPVQDRLFEPFFTTKDVGRGTGLGLSTAHTIVKSHGGFIEVYSEVGHGAQFNVYLPALEHVAAESVATADLRLPRGDGRTVLLVDDEGAIRTIVQQTLQTHGYVVLSAADGAEALEVFFANRETIDVVLTDMAMPILDGPTMVAALHAIEPRLPVIGSSGLVTVDSMQRAIDAGMLDFVAKPYTAEALLMTLDRVLSPLQRRGKSSTA